MTVSQYLFFPSDNSATSIELSCELTTCLLNQYMGSSGECVQCPDDYTSDEGSTSIDDCTPCPAGSELLHPQDSSCVLSLDTEDIVLAQGWRIWAPDFHTQKGWTWDVDELEFYEDADCNGDNVDPNLGTPVDSGNAGSGWGPGNAFGNWWIWGGRKDADGTFWLGLTFDQDIIVRCAKFINANWDDSAVTEVRIQAYIEAEDRWKNAGIVDNLNTAAAAVNVLPFGKATLEPSASPSSSPSSSPTIEICEDSPLPVTDTNGKGCAFLADNLQYCALSGVPSHCPVTCDSCFDHECADSEMGWDIQGGSYTCAMLAAEPQTLIDLYCGRFPDLTKTCRLTCRFCPTKSPSSSPTTLAPTRSPVNIAVSKPTEQSSISSGGVSSRAVDGNISGLYGENSVTHTANGPGNWWKVHLEESYNIFEIKVYNREDCCASRLDGFSVHIYLFGEEVWSFQNPPGTPPYENILEIPGGMFGDEVKVKLPNTSNNVLSLAEVMVMSPMGNS